MAQSLRASPDGLAIADRARRRLGWTKMSTARWWQDAHTSRATLRRFWRGERIQQAAFVAICQAVGIADWQQVAWPETALEAGELSDPLAAFDWDEAPAVEAFYGRADELQQLERWLVGDRHPLVTLVGPAGIGKTALALTLAEQVQAKFAGLIWRSPQPFDSLAEIAASLLDAPCDHWQAGQKSLLNKLRQQRYLLVFDGWEAAPDSQPARAEFFHWFSQQRHPSQALVTSRQSLRHSVGARGPLPQLKLTGLSGPAAIALLQAADCTGTPRQLARLARHYDGNPLALKLLVPLIHSLFGGQGAAFLTSATAVVGDRLRALLEQQAALLRPLERDILYWLTVWQQPIAFARLQTHWFPGCPTAALLAGLANLTDAASIEQYWLADEPAFALPPLLGQFWRDRLVQQASLEVQRVLQRDDLSQFRLWRTHSLLRPGADDLAGDRILVAIGQALQQARGDSGAIALQRYYPQLAREPLATTGYLRFNLAAYLARHGAVSEQWP